MTLTEDLFAAGLARWKGVVTPDPRRSGERVCVLTSPGYNPITGSGRLITRRGRDAADAFARAVEAAKEIQT